MSQVDTVIYVWSPRMALSVLHANEVADQAHLLGLRFLPLVDGRVPEEEWQSALTADLILTATMPGRHSALQSSQSLCSNRLLALDAYQHFPSVFMVRSDQLQAEKWTGAMSSRNWFEAFNADLKSLYRPAMPMLVSQNSDDANTPIKLLTRTSIAFEVDILQRGESCVPPNEFIVLSPEMAGLGDDKAVALGAYERVSPDGRFVLRSFSGKQLSSVSLMELPAPSFEQNSGESVVAGITQTPLSNEAFPVQGSWRYVVDTDGQHFTFSDLLSKQKNAKPKFQGGMSGFYAAAAEVGSTYPAHSFDAVQIRSLSWPNASNDSDTSGEGMLTSRTITVNTGSHRIQADSGRVNLCLGRVPIDGSLYALPMISIDGRAFAALPQRPVGNVSTMRIFGFGSDGKQCLPQQQFTSPTGKVTFGFGPNNPTELAVLKQADLVYEHRGQVWWYVSQISKAMNLAPWQEQPVTPLQKYRQKILASAFPGLTRDGRVIYAATWQTCTGTTCANEGGYVVSDPYQSNAYMNFLKDPNNQATVSNVAKRCITKNDVLRERRDFANFHGIAYR